AEETCGVVRLDGERRLVPRGRRRPAQSRGDLRLRIQDRCLTNRACQALVVAADPNALPRKRVGAEQLDLRRPSALEVTHLQRAQTGPRCREYLGQLRDHVAVVEHLLAERDAAVCSETTRKPRGAGDVEPVPVLVLAAVVR